MSELRRFLDLHDMRPTPLIGNVYLLGPRVAQLFNEGRMPGIVLTNGLRELCQQRAQSPDGGRAFFLEFAAKQIALYRGLGYQGVYLGGVHNFPAIERLLEIERTFAPDDWKQFAREIQFSRPGEYFFYEQDSTTKLAAGDGRKSTPAAKSRFPDPVYQLSKWSHRVMFTRGGLIAQWGGKLSQNATDPRQGAKVLRWVERASKGMLFRCQDCGDCSLPEIAYLCPESQCAKNQRNGPCGGTREGRCEVDGYGECIWLRAYERLKREGRERELLAHAPVVQNQGLRGTSAWANF
jgi:methylenetetrahydrofolate reductase (NADPH)